MSRQNSHPIIKKRVPDVAVEVVVSSEQQSSALAESYRCNSTDDIFVAVCYELLICSDVEETAGRVVATCSEGHPVGEEGDRVDVTLVSSKGLLAHTITDVPQLGTGVASTCK